MVFYVACMSVRIARGLTILRILWREVILMVLPAWCFVSDDRIVLIICRCIDLMQI